MMRDYGMDIDEGCKLFLEQMAGNRFWVHSHPETSKQIIDGRIAFFQSQEAPVMAEMTRQLVQP